MKNRKNRIEKFIGKQRVKNKIFIFIMIYSKYIAKFEFKKFFKKYTYILTYVRSETIK